MEIGVTLCLYVNIAVLWPNSIQIQINGIETNKIKGIRQSITKYSFYFNMLYGLVRGILYAGILSANITIVLFTLLWIHRHLNIKENLLFFLLKIVYLPSEQIKYQSVLGVFLMSVLFVGSSLVIARLLPLW